MPPSCNLAQNSPSARHLKRLRLQPLRLEQIPAVVALDQACLGGLWSAAAYQREISSPNSDLLGLEARVDNYGAMQCGAMQCGAMQCGAVSAAQTQLPSSSQLEPSSFQLIGLACLWAILEEGHITLLGIDPAWQSQGLGQLLLWRLLWGARRRGLERATLEVRASNRAAISLYGKLGFRSAGERKGYYSDGENALILWRKGLQTEVAEQELKRFYRNCCDRLQTFHWQLSSPQLDPPADIPVDSV